MSPEFRQKCLRVVGFLSQPVGRGWLLAGYIGLVIAGAWALATIESNQDKVQAAIAEIQELRQQRIVETALTDYRLCERVQETDAILIDLIEGIIRLPPAPGQTERQRRERLVPLRRALKELRPENCDRLASQRPFKELRDGNPQ